MADKPIDKSTLPTLLSQNPSPVTGAGLARVVARRQQVDRIMEVFLQMLPSTYVSQIQGPFYTIQFQAMAEVIADIQIGAQEAFADSDFDYTRPEFLFQILGSLVFPDAETDGYPSIKGDLTYRDFMKRMVALLLQGATTAAIEGGLNLLSEDVTWQVVEKSLLARSSTKRVWNKATGAWETSPGSSWGLDDQFEFEVNVSATNQFPSDPFVLQENVRLVLRALKPAHTLYEYRHLFQETFGELFDESLSWSLSNYHYEDFRKFCCGAKRVVGTAGVTWADKTLFSDTSRDFNQIRSGADLLVSSGANIGRYRVAGVLTFPVGTDTTARSYTTSPTGLTGTATVVGDYIEDGSQNFGLAVEGEVLTFASGPNAGAYRLKTLLGPDGGPVGAVAGPATRVRVSQSLLRLEPRMKSAATGQTYSVDVDRLGVQVPHAVQAEDASVYFLI